MDLVPGKNQPIKVLHLISGDLWGGAEAQFVVLLRGLAEHTDLSLGVVLLNEGRVAEEVRQLGIPAHVIPEDRNQFLALARHLKKHLQDRSPDILHSHRYKENALAAMVKRPCQIGKLVQTVHGFAPAHPGDLSFKERVISAIDHRVSGRYFNQVIPVSHDIAGRLRRYFPKQKISVVHNGVELWGGGRKGMNSNLRDELGLEASHLLIGAVGRMVPVKGFGVFLRSLPSVFLSHPNARALLVGDGPDLEDLQDLAETLGISERVHFLGFREDVQEVLGSLDLFVLSSHHEGIPMALLESMSLGIPPIATSVGGVPEVLNHQAYGRLVPPNDPRALSNGIIELLQDPGERRGIGRAAQGRVEEEFSSALMADRVAEVYRTLKGGSSL